MKNKRFLSVNILLGIIAMILLALCVNSILKPIVFNKKRQDRENAVKSSLIVIRKAQAAYLAANGNYSNSLDTLVNHKLLNPSDIYIPYSEGIPFELETDSIILRNGNTYPLMKCGARYDEYLYGMDEKQIEQLIVKATIYGRYPGLKIGDINTPNNNAGNWE